MGSFHDGTIFPRYLWNTFISWKKSKDITTSDYLLVNKTRSEMVYEDKVTEGEATFLGMLLAEGSLGYSNKFLFTNEDPEMLSLFFGRNLAGINVITPTALSPHL